MSGWTDPTVTWVNGDRPVAADFNTTIRDNLIYRRGDEVGQTEMQLDLLTFATRFHIFSGLPEFLSSYTSAGVAFRFVGENRDSPSALVTGNKVRLSAYVGEADTGTMERLARIEAERTAVGGSSLILDTDNAGVPHDPPAFRLLSNGHVQIQSNADNALVNVGGLVRAATYKQGGAAIGAWTLDGNIMRYTGDAEVSGQLRAGAQDGYPLRVASRTMCPNLNAAKMRGQAWPAVRLQAATTGAVSVPATGTMTNLVSVVAPIPGDYVIEGEVQVPMGSSGNLDGNVFYADLPGLRDTDVNVAVGTSYMQTGGDVLNGIQSIPVISKWRVDAAPETIWLRCSNWTSAPASVQGSLTAVWIAPDVDILASRFDETWTFSGTTSLA